MSTRRRGAWALHAWAMGLVGLLVWTAPAPAAAESVVSRLTGQPCAAGTLPLPALPGACTHGVDTRASLGLSPAPSTGNHHGTATGQSGEGDRADFVALRCDSPGNNRVQVLYAHSGRGALARALPTINQAVGVANGIFYRSAQQSSASRRLAVVAHSSGKQCLPTVLDITVSTNALNDFSQLLSEMQRQGLTSSSRKYLVFGDGTNALCGISTVYQDDRNTPVNINNLGGAVALAGSGQGCWDGAVVAHELTHAFGGVQPSAPHATAGMHCNDGADVMCYDDHTRGSRQRTVCASTYSYRLDCGRDDYFNPKPAKGSYLATHWNVANSSFLTGGGIAAPALPGTPADLQAEPEDTTVLLSWNAASGRVTSYQIQLPDGSTEVLPGTARQFRHQQPDRSRDLTYSVVALNETGPGTQATVTVAAEPTTTRSARPPVAWPTPFP